MFPALHIGFSGGRSGGLVFPSLSELFSIYCDPHSQRLGLVNKAEINVFLELSCFFDDPADLGNLISGSSAFSKTRLKLKKVVKITRPFRYDLNQIPYDYTVEVRNRFKGLDLIHRVPDELWTEVYDIVQETGIKTIPMEKK